MEVLLNEETKAKLASKNGDNMDNEDFSEVNKLIDEVVKEEIPKHLKMFKWGLTSLGDLEDFEVTYDLVNKKNS